MEIKSFHIYCIKKNYAKFNHKISERLTKRDNHAINTCQYVCQRDYCYELPLPRTILMLWI